MPIRTPIMGRAFSEASPKKKSRDHLDRVRKLASSCAGLARNKANKKGHQVTRYPPNDLARFGEPLFLLSIAVPISVGVSIRNIPQLARFSSPIYSGILNTCVSL